MNKKIVVIDASVIIKVFIQENDRKQTINLLKYLNQSDIKIIAPELLLTETLNVCLAKNISYHVVLKFFDSLDDFALKIAPIDSHVLRVACKIAESGNKQSGFPSFNDCVYHALAITHDTWFITADNRHKAKTERQGHIILLKDWQKIKSES